MTSINFDESEGKMGRLNKAEDIRQDVAQEYADKLSDQAYQAAVPGSKALYDSKELEEVPVEALGTSFGCGNPLSFLEVKEGDTIVDLGSGAGLDLIIAGQKVGSNGHVIGVDMTDAMIQRARENVVKAGLENVEVRKGVIEELPVEDSSVDWVISNCVVNLSPEKPKVFREIVRVLKPDGKMLISDIVIEGIPASLRQFVSLFNASVSGSIGELEYIEGLKQAGLQEVQIKDRLIYDAAFIESMIRAELEGSGGTSGPLWKKSLFGLSRRCLPIKRLARFFEGKVSSIKIQATKPKTT